DVRRTITSFMKTPDEQKIIKAMQNAGDRLVVYFPPKPGQIDGVPVMIYEVRGTFYQIDAGGQILKAQGTPKESRFIARVHLTSELEQKLTTRTNFSFASPNPLVRGSASGWVARYKRHVYDGRNAQPCAAPNGGIASGFQDHGLFPAVGELR